MTLLVWLNPAGHDDPREEAPVVVVGGERELLLVPFDALGHLVRGPLADGRGDGRCCGCGVDVATALPAPR